MTRIAHNSRPHRAYNEDFSFYKELPGCHIFVVGDFARSNYTGLDKLAAKLLKEAMEDEGLEFVPMPTLIAHLASRFNNLLLNQQNAWNMNFQCCAVFAGIAGTMLHYLSIGDCRIAVRRKQILLMLNGTLWVEDPTGNLLPPVIPPNLKMMRGSEPPPAQALGIRQEFIPPALVQPFPLAADDQVLLYSDGVDKVLSPAQLLATLGNGQLSSGLDQSALNGLVEQVLAEVEINRSDDDRTFLIASGPHVRAESQEFLEGQNQIKKSHLLLTGQIEEIKEEMKDLKEKHAELTNALEAAQQNTKEIATLRKSIESLDVVNKQELSAQLTTLQNGLLNAISSVGAQVQTIKRFEPHRPDGGLPAGPPPALPPAPPISQPPVTVALPLEGAGTAPAPLASPMTFVKVVRQIDERNNFKAEGKIYLKEGMLHFKGGNKPILKTAGQPYPTFFIVAEQEAPDGWLTLLYLFLRMLPTLPFSSGDPAGVEEYIKKEPTDALSKLREQNPNLFISLRDSYSERREKHGGNLERLRKQEEELIAQLQASLQKAFPDTEKADTDQKIPWWYRAKGQVAFIRRSNPSAFFVGIIVMVVLIALAALFIPILLSAYSSWREAVPEKNQNNNTVRNHTEPPPKRFGLDFGADGRTLELVEDKSKRTRLDFRVQPDKKEALLNAMNNQQFTTETEVENWLRRDEIKGYIAKRGTALTPPPGTRFFDLKAADLQKGDTCTNFLKRVNPLLPQGVHADCGQIENLNSDLRWGDLQVGDELLVPIKRK